jgi:hypothetical protein
MNVLADECDGVVVTEFEPVCFFVELTTHQSELIECVASVWNGFVLLGEDQLVDRVA